MFEKTFKPTFLQRTKANKTFLIKKRNLNSIKFSKYVWRLWTKQEMQVFFPPFISRCLYIKQREPSYQNLKNVKGLRRQYLRKRRGKTVPINKIRKIQTKKTKFLRKSDSDDDDQPINIVFSDEEQD